MTTRVLLRGFGRLLTEHWQGPRSDTRVVEFSRASEPGAVRVAVVLRLAAHPERRIDRRGGTSSGWGRGAHGFWPKVRKERIFAPADCWVWTGPIDRDGAGKFCTPIDGKPRSFRAPRRAWELLRGPLLAGQSIIALCGNAACVNPDHRKPIEHTALVRTLHELGRPFEYADNKGEMSGRAILTEEDVLFIRLQAQVYGAVPLLARLFGVSKMTVQAVKYGRTWKHLHGRSNKSELITLGVLRKLVESRTQDRADLAQMHEDAPNARTGYGMSPLAAPTGVRLAIEAGELNNAEIGREFGLHPGSVSRLRQKWGGGGR